MTFAVAFDELCANSVPLDGNCSQFRQPWAVDAFEMVAMR